MFGETVSGSQTMTEITFLQGLTIVAGVVALMAVFQFVLRFLELKNERRPLAADGAVQERLARIEAAVESTALEVERISESHRFMSMLLADHATGAVPPTQHERMITPR
jgi:alkylation response protein AidB-like acyl-CoA dehydrogenase